MLNYLLLILLDPVSFIYIEVRREETATTDFSEYLKFLK